MQDLTIGLVQANQLWEDVIGNLRHYESLLSSVEQVDLLLLPEMFTTGFTMNTQLAEEMSDSSSISWLQDIAQRMQTAVYTSLIIKEGDHVYNRGVFVDEKGNVTTYDKRKTFGLAGENEHYTSGNTEVVVEYKGWKLQLQICYDLRFPEIVRNELNHDVAKYDAILYVANWPERRAHHWKSLLIARAIENQSYVFAVNRVGEDHSGLSYSGDSTIISPLGELIAQSTGKEAVVISRVKFEELNETRVKFPFLKDRHV